MAERPTYIDFLKALDYRLTEYGLTSTEQLLYHTLLLINNRKRWVDWFPCTDVYLTELMGVGRTAMHTARNGLKQAGMIDFKTSNKRGTSTTYHVCDEFCTTVCVYSINTQTNNKRTTNKPQTNNKPAPNKDIRHKTKDINNNPLTPFDHPRTTPRETPPHERGSGELSNKFSKLTLLSWGPPRLSALSGHPTHHPERSVDHH